MPPKNPMTEGEALAVLDVDAIASSLVDWMLTKAMPNGDLLHASVACDYAGMANFKRAVSKQLRAALTAHTAASGGEVGELDRSAPERVWLQVDTEGDNDDRSEPMSREAWDVLTWHYEPLGGQEVEYVRIDLAERPPASVPVAEFRAAVLDVLNRHTTEMEGYSYFSSNPGIPKDSYEEIADDLTAIAQKGDARGL